MPAGPGFIKYEDFRTAYEILRKHTRLFENFSVDQIFSALLENSRSFCVLRAILGVTPPEWAELARSEYFDDIPQNASAWGQVLNCQVSTACCLKRFWGFFGKTHTNLS